MLTHSYCHDFALSIPICEEVKKIYRDHSLHSSYHIVIPIYITQHKDKDPKEKQSAVIYHYQCPATDCGDEYIGETARTFGEQCREHMREPCPIQVHRQLTEHHTTMLIFNILGREDQDLTRLIKEAIFIRVNNPTINRKIGKFQLSHI